MKDHFLRLFVSATDPIRAVQLTIVLALSLWAFVMFSAIRAVT